MFTGCDKRQLRNTNLEKWFQSHFSISTLTLINQRRTTSENILRSNEPRFTATCFQPDKNIQMFFFHIQTKATWSRTFRFIQLCMYKDQHVCVWMLVRWLHRVTTSGSAPTSMSTF